MATEVGLLDGGALLGTILAALGLKKMITTEVNGGLKPLKEELGSVQIKLSRTMLEKDHKIICQLNATNVAQQISAMREISELQNKTYRDHIDQKFEELNKRLDREREERK